MPQFMGVERPEATAVLLSLNGWIMLVTQRRGSRPWAPFSCAP